MAGNDYLSDNIAVGQTKSPFATVRQRRDFVY